MLSASLNKTFPCYKKNDKETNKNGHINTSINMDARIHKHIHINTHAHTHTQTRTHAHTHIQTRTDYSPLIMPRTNLILSINTGTDRAMYTTPFFQSSNHRRIAKHRQQQPGPLRVLKKTKIMFHLVIIGSVNC